MIMDEFRPRNQVILLGFGSNRVHIDQNAFQRGSFLVKFDLKLGC